MVSYNLWKMLELIDHCPEQIKSTVETSSQWENLNVHTLTDTMEAKKVERIEEQVG